MKGVVVWRETDELAPLEFFAVKAFARASAERRGKHGLARRLRARLLGRSQSGSQRLIGEANSSNYSNLLTRNRHSPPQFSPIEPPFAAAYSLSFASSSPVRAASSVKHLCSSPTMSAAAAAAASSAAGRLPKTRIGNTLYELLACVPL